MTRYAYKAKDGPSRTVSGDVEADSHGAAVSRVEAMGYSPLWVRETEEATAARGRRGRRRRVRGRDITVLTGQLASLSRSAVPILRALRTIEQQTDNSGLRRVVADMTRTVRDGKMLSESMAAYPRLFPELYVNMIRAGEQSGALDIVLTRLTEAREKEEDTRRKVQAALAYPILILAVGVGTVFALFAFFLPRVLELFEGYDALPLPTRILVGTTEFVSANWYWLVFAVVLAGAVLNRLAALEKGRTFFDRIVLSIPLVRTFLLQSDIARFARTLGLLIDTGVPIDRSLALGARTLNNAILREEVETARDNTVRQGRPLSEGLHDAGHFPPFVANLIAVGEEGGRLPETLAEVAAFYEKEVEQQARVATGLLEPLMILVVGGIVGFIVAAMLLPIFELGSQLR